jgi:hypothetical protein
MEHQRVYILASNESRMRFLSFNFKFATKGPSAVVESLVLGLRRGEKLELVGTFILEE